MTTLLTKKPVSPIKNLTLGHKIRAHICQWRWVGSLADWSFIKGMDGLNVIPPDNWPGDAALGSAIVKGDLYFCGETVHLDRPNWFPENVSIGFLRALHSFNWLHDLRTLNGDVARRQARLMVRSWIEEFSSWSEFAWDPTILGRRVTNWIGLYDFFCSTADDEFCQRVHMSLRHQTRYLMRSIHMIPSGYRRISALKGLFYAGVCLPNGEAKLALALRLLNSELSAQILPDGGHCERNPLALLDVLRHLIDIRAVLRAGAQEVPEKLQHAIDRMTPALRFFRYHDGGLGLFNGGREGPPQLIELTLQQADARGKPLRSMKHMGFERLSLGKTLIMMDCGMPTTAAAQKSSHAGILSFEMSVGRDRFIVNCGSHPSGHHVWQEALASTAAHSTLTLNDTNAFECLSSDVTRLPQRVNCERQDEKEAVWVECFHDAYEALYQTLHFRRIYLGDDGEDVRGEDALEGPEGIPFCVRFHLHPNVQASLIQQGMAVLLALPSGGGWRFRASGASIALEESIYCGKDDEIRQSVQIVLTGITNPLETVIKWAFQKEKKS